LEATLQEVKKIKKDHLDFIKVLAAPAKPIIVVLTGVVIMMGDVIK